jgi:hypothetical protein
VLEASGRAAIDIPAHIRRSPAKAAGIAGAIGFLALKGPQRLVGAARRAIGGKPAPMPSRMLPDEVEKTLRKLGNDGEKVRGALERDFADYAKKSQKERRGLVTLLVMAGARPLLARAGKAAGELFFSPDSEGFSARLAEIRARAGEGVERGRESADQAAATARERIAAARREDRAAKDRGDRSDRDAPTDESAPTGI